MIEGKYVKTCAATIIAMERAALDRWGKGDPSGYLEISAPDVVYFDSFLEHRLDGLEKLTNYYETIRGKIRIDHDEIIDPKVQVCNDMAVLRLITFHSAVPDRCDGTALKFIAIKMASGVSSSPIGQSLNI